MYIIIDIVVIITITVFLLMYLFRLYQRNFIICDKLLVDKKSDILRNITRIQKQYCDNELCTSTGYVKDKNKNVELHYCTIIHPNARSTIMFVHGNRGSIDRHLPKAFNFAIELCCNVVLFDYAGFGNSNGTCLCSNDLLSNTETIHTSVILQDDVLAKTDLYIYGISLGCLPATMLAFQPNVRCAGLIIENGFYNLSYLINQSRYILFKCFPSSWIYDDYDITKISYSSKQHLPVMIMCSLNDAVIPYKNSLKIYDHLHRKGIVNVSLVRNADIDIGHTNAWKFGSVYYNSFRQFMSIPLFS